MNKVNVYEWARRVDPAQAAVKIVESKSEAERKFWIYVHDMNLSQQLHETIAKSKED